VKPENRQAITATLFNLLQQSSDPQLRAKAAESLGRLKVEEAIPLLCQTVNQDPEIQVRLAAIDAMVAIAQPPILKLMTDKPQPIFNINQVGNINTGDVEIQGDQIGIQYNVQATEASQQLETLLAELRKASPNATDAEIFEILLQNFQTMPNNNAQGWQHWESIFSVVFAGGVEAIKVIAPVLGIPIEGCKRLFEIYQKNRQLPGG
jgi:HEAT repeats